MAEESTTGDSPCIFCEMINGGMAVTLVHSDEEVIVINDINPQAPIHQLVIPRKHIDSLATTEREDTLLLGHMLYVAKTLADEHRLSKGYRIQINTGREGGQTVPHIHLHLLGGGSLEEVTA